MSPGPPRSSTPGPRWSSLKPTDKLAQTIEVVTKNMEAALASAATRSEAAGLRECA